ncbi:elongation factor P [bacterium]|nr:elongation factor P [bacterium]MBT7310181.1 elongation factor P [bacterium]
MASTSDFRNGLVLEMKNGLWTIVDFQHVKPGKGPAFVRTKLKNVQTGKVIEETFRAGEKVDDVRLERRDHQFLFADADFLTFMSLETYEQVSLPKDTLGDLPLYVKESETVSMLLRDNIPLTVEPPQTVDLKVADTDPGLKGDTAQGGTKPATMETGLVVLVPLFIEIGEILKIDTRTKKYLGRV